MTLHLPDELVCGLGAASATDLLETARRVVPADQLARAVCDLGGMALDRGLTSVAEHLWADAARSDDPEHWPAAATWLGELHAERDELDRADALLARAGSSSHREFGPRARVDLGVLRAREGHLAEAEDLLRRAATADHPVHRARAVVQLADVLVCAHRPPEAEQIWSEGLSAADAELAMGSTVGLGVLYLARSQVGRAYPLLKKAWESAHPEHAARAGVHLGDALTRLADEPGATVVWEWVSDTAHPVYSGLAKARMGDNGKVDPRDGRGSVWRQILPPVPTSAIEGLYLRPERLIDVGQLQLAGRDPTDGRGAVEPGVVESGRDVPRQDIEALVPVVDEVRPADSTAPVVPGQSVEASAAGSEAQVELSPPSRAAGEQGAGEDDVDPLELGRVADGPIDPALASALHIDEERPEPGLQISSAEGRVRPEIDEDQLRLLLTDPYELVARTALQQQGRGDAPEPDEPPEREQRSEYEPERRPTPVFRLADPRITSVTEFDDEEVAVVELPDPEPVGDTADAPVVSAEERAAVERQVAVARVVDRLRARGRLSVIASHEMVRGRARTVEVHFDRSGDVDAQLRDALGLFEHDDQWQVTLQPIVASTECVVEPIQDERASASGSGHVSWRYALTPRRRGEELVIFALVVRAERVEEEPLDETAPLHTVPATEVVVPLLERSIVVAGRGSHLVRTFFASNAKWMIAAVVCALIVTVVVLFSP